MDTLEKRREKQDMAPAHKITMGGQLGQIFEMTDVNDRPRTTRQTEGEYRLIQRFARTDPRKYSFAVRAVDPCNKLPDDLKLATCKEQFNARMKTVKNVQQVRSDTNEMEMVKHNDEKKWLLPAYMVNKLQHHKQNKCKKTNLREERTARSITKGKGWAFSIRFSA